MGRGPGSPPVPIIGRPISSLPLETRPLTLQSVGFGLGLPVPASLVVSSLLPARTLPPPELGLRTYLDQPLPFTAPAPQKSKGSSAVCAQHPLPLEWAQKLCRPAHHPEGPSCSAFPPTVVSHGESFIQSTGSPQCKHSQEH